MGNFLDAALFAVMALSLPDTSAICRSTSWVMVLVEALALVLVAGLSTSSSPSSISWDTIGILLLMAGCYIILQETSLVYSLWSIINRG